MVIEWLRLLQIVSRVNFNSCSGFKTISSVRCDKSSRCFLTSLFPSFSSKPHWNIFHAHHTYFRTHAYRWVVVLFLPPALVPRETNVTLQCGVTLHPMTLRRITLADSGTVQLWNRLLGHSNEMYGRLKSTRHKGSFTLRRLDM